MSSNVANKLWCFLNAGNCRPLFLGPSDSGSKIQIFSRNSENFEPTYLNGKKMSAQFFGSISCQIFEKIPVIFDFTIWKFFQNFLKT